MVAYFAHGVRRMLLPRQWGDVSRTEFMPSVYVAFQLIFSGVKVVAKFSFCVPWRLMGLGRGGRNIVPIILNPSTRWTEWLVSHPGRFNLGQRTLGRLRLKCDGTRAETRFHLSCETDESI